MLRINSKQARINLHQYIMTSWNLEPEDQGRSWQETAEAIREAFSFEAYSSEYERKQNRQQAFKGWLAGLPRGLGDFNLCQAVDDLGDILDQSQEERNRYSEEQAGDLLAYLIYKEVME